MRVTEHRMLQLAADQLGQNRERVAKAAGRLASGLDVQLPSDDVVRWGEGMRAESAAAESRARGGAIDRAREQLSQVENSLGDITNGLLRARELAVQMANGTWSATDRQGVAAEVIEIRQRIVASASVRGVDGDYLLSGSLARSGPYDALGNYIGDAEQRRIESGPGGLVEPSSVNAEGLTAANGGVDIVPWLDALVVALQGNSQAGVQATLDPIAQAVDQASLLRSQVGDYLHALDDADSARASFEVNLAKIKQRAVDTDPVAAASDLAGSQIALQASQAIAQMLNAMFTNR